MLCRRWGLAPAVALQERPQTTARCGGKEPSVSSVAEKARHERVRWDPMKANASESQMTCRNSEDGIETRLVLRTWDEPGGNLSTAQAVPGMYAARARVRLLYGTWEPVVSREPGSWSSDLRPVLPGEAPSRSTGKGRGPDARHRGGPLGSSDEGPVIGLERSERAIQARKEANRQVGGRSR